MASIEQRVTRAPHGHNDLPIGLEKIIPNPGMPRSDSVPSKERPQGHYATPKGRTPLQMHLDLFDSNKDGVITPFETFRALRYLRFAWEPINSIIALWVALAFHLAFAWPSQTSWFPDPRLYIYTSNASHLVHGSSTHTINREGRYVPQKFEEIWTKYDPSGAGHLSLVDVFALVWGQASVGDVFGTLATGGQWLLAWWLFRDDNGYVHKNDVRGLYDGTAFYRLADHNGAPWYGMSARRDAVEKQHMG